MTDTRFKQQAAQERPSTIREPSLDEKVAFLSKPEAYALGAGDVVRRETHMSWVFLAGDKAYKLKKPVRLPYLDFSTLARREAACRAELKLNRRLAQGIYLDVVPLRLAGAMSIGGDGHIVDWLVVMRRLDETGSLEQAIRRSRIRHQEIDSFAGLLVAFYRHAARARVSAPDHLVAWRQSLADNRHVLLKPELGLPAYRVRRIDRVQRRFLDCCPKALLDRVHHIVDGHGDLRPEHIWLNNPGPIIDCIEFNARLRSVDPFDEVAYLSVECERLGARWIGERVKRHLIRALHDPIPEDLFTFYRCYRASLRARLSIAHLLGPNPRTPEKWPAQALTYLDIAERNAIVLERTFSSQAARPRIRSR